MNLNREKRARLGSGFCFFGFVVVCTLTEVVRRSGELEMSRPWTVTEKAP